MGQLIFNILIACCVLSIAIPLNILWADIRRKGKHRKNHKRRWTMDRSKIDEVQAQAQKVYNEAITQARKTYDEAMTLAWKVYDETMALIWKAHDEIRVLSQET